MKLAFLPPSRAPCPLRQWTLSAQARRRKKTGTIQRGPIVHQQMTHMGNAPSLCDNPLPQHAVPGDSQRLKSQTLSTVCTSLLGPEYVYALLGHQRLPSYRWEKDQTGISSSMLDKYEGLDSLRHSGENEKHHFMCTMCWLFIPDMVWV